MTQISMAYDFDLFTEQKQVISNGTQKEYTKFIASEFM